MNHISAICVSGGPTKASRNEHLDHCLPVAATCFHNQTYPERSLVIVSEEITTQQKRRVLSLCPGDHVIFVQTSDAALLALGELRNAGLAAAREQFGEQLAIQWDDDDWHHPQRMAAQAAVHEFPGAVCLARQLCYGIPTDVAFLRHFYGLNGGTFIHGTILHTNLARYAYPPKRTPDDTLFLRHWPTIQVLDCPELYVRYAHPGEFSTSGWAHIMREAAGWPNHTWALGKAHRKVMEQANRDREQFEKT